MIELPDISTVPLKRCAKCLDWWPNDDEFYHRSGRTWRTTCKACHNERQQIRHQMSRIGKQDGRRRTA